MDTIALKMKPAVELEELTARIRQAAHRESGPGRRQPREDGSDLPPVADPVPPPPVSASVEVDALRPESLLDQADSLLRGGRKKTAVSKAVPGWLRPLFRNQGGYNDVVLAASERLVEVNRTRRQQAYDLHERLIDFQAWAHTVAEISAENREWMLAVDARLQTLARERAFEPGEATAPPSADAMHDQAKSSTEAAGAGQPPIDAERLAWLTAHVEAMEIERRALNDHLNRLRAQIDEQAEYIRTVHHHLDQLGAHVDATLTRPDRAV